ncbi:MAG: hypothetical protein NC203_07835 [Firmicutes bacterium]|nr:hypothetical protein [[Eubacterium] siraeum]MCM1488259.1 hypothetical protein [Bacillota bacterium]
MKPINANETGYERFEILGHDALFTNMRIDRKSLPEGIYGYDLRDSDDCNGEPSELRNYVMVNHWGTVLVKEPIEGADKGIVLEEGDYSYLGDDMTIEEFSNSAPVMEQSM